MGTLALIARLIVAFPRILELLDKINRSVNEEIKRKRDTDRFNANSELIDKWMRNSQPNTDKSPGVSDETRID